MRDTGAEPRAQERTLVPPQKTHTVSGCACSNGPVADPVPLRALGRKGQPLFHKGFYWEAEGWGLLVKFPFDSVVKMGQLFM